MPNLTPDDLSEDWLRACGFKWEQCDRQPSKHWILWLGDALVDPVEGRAFCDSSDLGIELAKHHKYAVWYCWIRADYGMRYCRFLHVRHMAKQAEVVQLIEALTGRPFVPADSMYGCLRTTEDAERLRKESERLDKAMARQIGQSIERQKGMDPDQIGVIR